MVSLCGWTVLYKGLWLMGKAGDIRRDQIREGLEYSAKELKLLPESLHRAHAKLGPCASGLT